jgi:hypothetical protein
MNSQKSDGHWLQAESGIHIDQLIENSWIPYIRPTVCSYHQEKSGLEV